MLGVVIVKVGPAARHADEGDEWERAAKAHFLSCTDYERLNGGEGRRQGPERRGEKPMQTLVCLALLLAPFYGLYRVTVWCCPWAVDVSQRVGRALVSIARCAGRVLLKLTWSKPAQAYGVAATMWFGTVATAAACTLAALVSWRLAWLWAAVVWWGLVFAGWWLLRRLAIHRHRPRVLPARRERR